MYRESVYRGPRNDGSQWRSVTKGPGRHDQFAVVDGKHRCRRCDWCRRQRAASWAQRARAAMLSGIRTWWVTLTLNPIEEGRLFAAARRAAVIGGWDFEDERVSRRLLAAEVSTHATKYLKRLRKENSACPGDFSYMLVVEFTKRGVPHLHMALTELQAERPYRKAMLEDQWPLGYSLIKLLPQTSEDLGRVGSYLAKYMTKDAGTRIRASRGYGRAVVREAVIGEAVPVAADPQKEDLKVAADTAMAVRTGYRKSWRYRVERIEHTLGGEPKAPIPPWVISDG